MTKDLKRSIRIQGHRTSVSLEPEFWDELKLLAAKKSVAVSVLISEIDKSRGNRNLSSAIRTTVLHALKTQG
jgi:predicted DNA-binding ribbon-helix-helix protein